MIPDGVIEEIKYRNDIESVISSYVQVKRRGRNLVGLCPFHSEKTPSFTVYPDSQSFFCFGCGAGGDVVTFIRRMENLDYREALKFLAERAGMKLSDEYVEDDAAKLKMRILEINRTAASFYYNSLVSDVGKGALGYLTERGLSKRIIRKFGLGYAPDSWNALLYKLKDSGFSEKEIEASGVVIKNRNGKMYDAYRNRVIFPIIDLRGNVIGFGARKLEGDGPKYINSPDTSAYKKSRNLFALNFAKNDKSGNIILVEGYMDAISLYQAGFENTVATCGTALTAEQARLISQYAKSVTISYDSDEAGVKAARRAVPLLDAAGVRVKALRIEGAKDPDEYIKKFGALRFKKMIEDSSSAAEYELDLIKRKYDVYTNEGKIAILKESCVYVAGVVNPLEREVYAGNLSKELGVEKDAIVRQINEIIRRKSGEERKKSMRDLKIFDPEVKNGRIVDPDRAKHIKTAVAQEKLIACMLKYPEYAEKIIAGVDIESMPVAANRRIFEVAAERIKQGLAFDFTQLNAELSIEEISRAAALMAGCEIKFTDADVDYYIKMVRESTSEMTPEKVGELEDDEYLNNIRAAIEKKKE